MNSQVVQTLNRNTVLFQINFPNISIIIKALIDYDSNL